MEQDYIKATIIDNSLIKYSLSSDYEQQKRLYQNTIKQIKNNSVLSQIYEIERLLKVKTKIEIIFAYQKGARVTKPFTNADMENFYIEDLNLDALCSNNINYNKLEDVLKNMRNCLRDTANNEYESERIESLFEVYSYCNYEILKCAFFIGANPSYIIPCDIKYNGLILGQKLKQCRKDANLSQEALGQLLKTERSNISNYERGNNKPPISIIIEYSKLFNVSPLYLLYDTVPIDTKKLFTA